MKKIAFIFARGGSKGLKDKNILPFLRKPLITYSIEFAKKSKLFDDIYVSTDSLRIEKIAKLNGVKVIKRPKKYATDKSKELDAWKHAINFLYKKNIEFDVFISLPATSPIRSKKYVKECIKKSKLFNFVITYTKTNRNPWFNMVKVDKNKKIKIVNKPVKPIFRRQDAPKVFDMSTNCFVSTPNYILKSNNLLQDKVGGVEIPIINAIDIDTKYDFEFAEFVYKKNIKLNKK